MIDLHIHTTASADGQYDPAPIVTMAARIGLTAIAFGDHNTIGSVAEGKRLCREAGIDFVEGIELNTDYGELDLHMLGYGFDPEDRAFVHWLDSLQQKRLKRAETRAARLQELGLVLEYDEVAALTPGRLPTASSFLRALETHPENRNHPLIAPYLTGGARADNPYVNFYFEVMAKPPVKVHVPVLPTHEAIERLIEFGALPILAHPNHIDLAIVNDLIDEGLAGIEAISSYHDKETTARFLKLAEERDLLVTAGSDFHGPQFKPSVTLGGVAGNDRRFFDELMETLGR